MPMGRWSPTRCSPPARRSTRRSSSLARRPTQAELRPARSLLGTRSKVAVALTSFAVLIAAGIVLDLRSVWLAALEWLRGLGPAAQGVFLVGYVTAVVALLPSTFLDLGAGAVFGLVRGSILVSTASLAGATASFLIGRYLARDWLVGRIAANDRFRRIDVALEREGWKIIALARLSPIFPFWLLNYGFGLTRVSLWHFVVATWIGMLPLIVLYVYAGSLVADLTALGAAGGERSPLEWAVYGLGLAATVLLGLVITGIARRALDEKTAREKS